jgi:hypothetical protein
MINGSWFMVNAIGMTELVVCVACVIFNFQFSIFNLLSVICVLKIITRMA